MATKLEELKAAFDAAEAYALDAIDAAWADYEAACDAARVAYKAELEKQENSDDH
jgi:hypothetical protein